MLEPVVIGFYGYSKSGKTKLITELISYNTKQNYKIACIKQTNKSYDVDKNGTSDLLVLDYNTLFALKFNGSNIGEEFWSAGNHRQDEIES